MHNDILRRQDVGVILDKFDVLFHTPYLDLPLDIVHKQDVFTVLRSGMEGVCK